MTTQATKVCVLTCVEGSSSLEQASHDFLHKQSIRIHELNPITVFTVKKLNQNCVR